MWLTKVSLSLLAVVAIASAQSTGSCTVGASAPHPDPEPPYTGPCTVDACGAEGKVCKRGWLCVAWPSSNPPERKGCVCTYG
ncbi:hypothetical protein QBC37DRAFT_292226 [Rhypophila decipiens]|uniref:Uncharacterized protein n=1 Tax=Rhypophila decipiens TaxID=261697 RepID=A0AAN6Y1N3_9PEZI|nr:hypothetical protein QBC37DRAFT_292226 [Rhypophila decipiens]